MHRVRWNQLIVRSLGALSRVREKDLELRVRQVEKIIELCAQELTWAGAGEADCSVRLFALCAFCDEVVLAPVACDKLWQYSQTRKRFENGQAGVEFYRIAQDLVERGDVALVVYWLVFRCGFRGRLDGALQEAEHWEAEMRGRLWPIVESVPRPAGEIAPSSRKSSSRWKTGVPALAAMVFYGLALWGVRVAL